MLSLEECFDLGVVMAEEQIDFLRHPEGRLAVVVYGVPDPDRLYIAGPDREATYYQLAPEGEPADERGMQACVLPIVFQGGDQEELARLIADWEGDVDDYVPALHGYPCDGEFMWAWTTDEVPISVACWDLWPITADDTHHWAGAAERTYYSSALPQMFELIENYNGSDYYGPDAEDLQCQLATVSNEIYSLKREDIVDPDEEARLLELADKYEALKEQYETVAATYIARLENAIIHPVTGDIDAQMPPVHLPAEQAAIWRSLQSLSWRNWSMLKKNSGHDGDALYGGRFVEANRRLCPWY